MRQKQALFSFYTIIVFDYGLLRVSKFYVNTTYEVLKLVNDVANNIMQMKTILNFIGSLHLCIFAKLVAPQKYNLNFYHKTVRTT